MSAAAVAQIQANAARNRLPHVEAREANAFDELRRLEKAGARYDTVVLDPPAFAKNKASRSRRRWPATRRSTCGRCGCSSPAASW